MFFFGVFGTNAKTEQAGYLDVAACPVCHDARPLHVVRQYSYFHAFFIPIFRFGQHYFATCPGCASVFAVEKDVAERAMRGGGAVPASALTLLQSNLRPSCPDCGADIEADDRFCRRCGRLL